MKVNFVIECTKCGNMANVSDEEMTAYCIHCDRQWELTEDEQQKILRNTADRL